VVFKRRDPRPFFRAIGDFFYPRGGWSRAFQYVKHRLRRLPDSPERIARGIWAGVFASFSPFFGMHFFVAALIARLMNGNFLASLMGTFFGNPVTYVPISLISLKTGHFLLGTEFDEKVHRSFTGKFVDAWRDLQHNFMTVFNDQDPDWQGLSVFYDEVFFPYLIGGIVPGVIAATVCYYITAPLIRVYQKRRKGIIKAKFEAIKKKAAVKADAKRNAE